jgi:hypothetical protein
MLVQNAKPALVGEMTALIETTEQTYFLQRNPATGGSFDEAIIDIVGRIETATTPYVSHIGSRIEVALRLSRSFPGDPSDGKISTLGPFQMMIGKRGCSVLAYLPSDAFWALPATISAKAVTHVGLTFGAPRHGSADLESIHFAPASRVNLS